MDLRTYQAYSLAEVIDQIKSDLGHDAVVLHTRTFKRGGVLGLGGKTVVEVTASTNASRRVSAANSSSRPAPRPNPRAQSTAQTSSDPRSRGSAPSKSPGTTVPPATTSPASSTSRDVVTDFSPVAASLIERAARLNASERAAVPSPRPKATLSAASVAATPAPTPARVLRPSRRHPPAAGTVLPTPISEAKPVRPVAKRFIVETETQKIVAPERLATAATAPRTSAAAEIQTTTIPETPSSSTTHPTSKSEASALSNSSLDLRTEIASLKQMVGHVLQRQVGPPQPPLPEALFNRYLSLIENEVAQDLASEVCTRVREDLSADRLCDADAVREAFLQHLSRYIPAAADPMPIERPADGRPFTLALVGPTGVGKTTTVAKLAAAYKLRHGKRVGLITTDTYRIAAVDQLRTYANIIGIPLRVALTPAEMAAACHDLRDCDAILIDTAGRSPNDAARIDEIRRFVEAASPHQVHLVLSSTFSEPVLLQTIERFAPVRADRIIFTKLDEAVSFGVLVNVMRRAGKELSFVTTGQEVPEHLEPGRAERLARLVLGEGVSG